MVNSHRGEIESDLFGKPMLFCLTLGALADIEARLGHIHLVNIIKRLSEGRMASDELIIILGAAARGGGQSLTNEEIAKLPLKAGLDRAYLLIADLFNACFDNVSHNTKSA